MVSRACLGLPDKPCGAVIPANRNRCDDCQRALWRKRPGREARGYTRRWRRISIAQRKRQPLCEIKLPGCTVIATAADHVIPLEDGGKSTASNARSACFSCNSRRRYLEKSMPAPTCRYCTREFADPRGCEYLEEDTRPVVYGQELDPISVSPTCGDCAAPKGTLHHVECSKAECPECYGQWLGCFGHHEEAA